MLKGVGERLFFFFKLPPFFLTYTVRDKRREISKKKVFQLLLSRSYIVFALEKSRTFISSIVALALLI